MTSRPPATTFARSLHRGVVVVKVAGGISSGDASELLRHLRLLRPSSGERVVVDLSAADFIDPSGLTALVRAHGDYRAVGADLWLVVGNDPRLDVLARFGLDRLFHTFPDLEAATL